MIDVINFKDCFEYYRANTQNKKSKYNFKQFAKILSLFMEKLVERLKEEGTINLPMAMGLIQVTGKKVKPRLDADGNILGLAPDWKLTKEMWEKHPELKEKKEMFYHTNEGTNGVRYKLHWECATALVKNKLYYTLVPARHLKRDIAKLITEGKEYFIKS